MPLRRWGNNFLVLKSFIEILSLVFKNNCGLGLFFSIYSISQTIYYYGAICAANVELNDEPTFGGGAPVTRLRIPVGGCVLDNLVTMLFWGRGSLASGFQGAMLVL